MRRIAALCILTILTLGAGCGDGVEPKAGDPDDLLAAVTKARLVEFIQLIKENKREELAKHVVYRGEDKDRKWKAVSDYKVADEKANVDRICKRMAPFIALGNPAFSEFKTEKESEGTWVAWKVTFGEGDKAKSVYMACLEINGQLELGDIDTSGD